MIELTPSELDVLLWITEGENISDIARIRNVSSHTVKSQIRILHRKLGSRTLAQMVALAYHQGVLKIPAGGRAGSPEATSTK